LCRFFFFFFFFFLRSIKFIDITEMIVLFPSREKLYCYLNYLWGPSAQPECKIMTILEMIPLEFQK